MAAKLLQKENADPADQAESLLPYTNKQTLAGRLINKLTGQVVCCRSHF